MTMVWRALVIVLLLVFPAIGPAFAQEGITGVASVIDGDTIEIQPPINLSAARSRSLLGY